MLKNSLLKKKTLKGFSILFLIVLLCFLSTSANAARSPMDVNIGLDMIISPDYTDTIEDAYPEHEMSGGLGWLGMVLGVKFNVSKQLWLFANAELMFNYVTGDENFMNSIFLPSIKALYKFKPGESFYISAEVNKNYPETGSDRLEFDSGGIGYGAFLGYNVSHRTSFELGMLHIPVDVTYKPYGGTEEKDFGGLTLRCMVHF